MEPDENPASATDERKLLIDAVTLLARNQSQAESELMQQAAESSRRMLALERRCLDLEQQIGMVQDQLARLSKEVLVPADPESQQRLTELRGQLARLAQRSDLSAPAPSPVVAQPAADFDVVRPAPADAPVTPVAPPRPVAPSNPPPAAPRASSTVRPVWRGTDVLSQDNAGLLLIGVGAVAVLFAVLTQVRV